MINRAALIPAFVIGLVTTSSAETPEQRQACTDDAFRVCQDAIPDRDRVFSCLLQNSSAISPLCRTALAPYLTAQPTREVTSKSRNRFKTKRGTKKTSARNRKGPLDLNPNAR